MDLIERSELLKDLDDLKKSPWYNIDNPFIQQGMRECMDMLETQCIKKAPEVEAIPIEWIEQYGRENWYDFGTQYNAITEMLKAWRKKNERN